MAPEDDQPDDTDVPSSEPPRTEGVRIVGAQEAAEAVARGDAGTRRGDGEPGYGDRPEPPREDDRPVLRFPSPIESRNPSSFGAVPVVRVEDEPPGDGLREPVAAADEPFELPHYSDPPTGQVPKVVIGESDEQSESWAGLSSKPRWRDQDSHYDDEADFSDLVDSGPRLGALDDGVSTAEDDFFGDDLDAPTSGFGDENDVIPTNRREAARTAVRRDPRTRKSPEPTGQMGRNLPVAIAVGVGLLALGLICFKLGTVPTTLLITVVLTLSAGEFFATVRGAGYNPATLLGLASVAGFAIAPVARPAVAYPIVIGITMLAGLIWFLWVNPGKGAVTNLGVTLLGIMWIGGLGSFATLLIGVGRVAENAQKLSSNPGIGVLIGAVLVSVSYDVGAFFGGKFLGHTPLSAASPNKTREGLIAGVALAVFLPLVIMKVPGIAPLGNEIKKTFAFCLFCAAVAPFGDLCQSAIKRDLEVKDMGDLLPGHGGVLDRFDGLLFVLPMAWFMVHLLPVAPF